MDCPNCSESFRLRLEYASHLGECMPRMIVDVSRGYLVTEIHGIRSEDLEPNHGARTHKRREGAPLAS